jgi:hypothetical protein
MFDVIQPESGEQRRFGVAFGDDEPALRDTREEVLEERLLEVLCVPLLAVVEF